MKSTPIDTLKWSVRARNCLQRADCATLWDIAERRDEEWVKIRNLGRTTLIEVKEKLAKFIAQHMQPAGKADENEKTISASERELLKWVGHSDPLGISSSTWEKLVNALHEKNKVHEPIGDIAARIGVKWPANRYEQNLSDFLLPDFALLTSQIGLGNTKLRAIMQCAITVWAERSNVSGDTTGSRAEILAVIAGGLETSQLSLAIQTAFAAAGVSNKQREILFQRYGIPNGLPRTLESIAQVYRMTRERIRQIQESAREKLIRPPDLRRVLGSGLFSLQPHFLGRLESEYRGFIPKRPRNEFLQRLVAWEGLLIELLHNSLDEWLNHFAEPTPIGWVHSGVTRGKIEDAKGELAAHLQSCNVPVPVIAVSRGTTLSENMVRLAALHGAGWLAGDFVALRRLRAKEQRVLRAHVQTRASGSPLLKRDALLGLFSLGMPEGSFRSRQFIHEAGCFPQLMLRCANEYVLRVTTPWEVTYPDLQPAPPPSIVDARSEDEESERDHEEDVPIYDVGFQLLRARKLWRMADMLEVFGRTVHGRYAATQLTAWHPFAQCFASGLWGVRDAFLTEPDYQVLLTGEDCKYYIEARWANTETTPFPMWTLDMELRWCRWAEVHASEVIFQSLLSVITPDRWSCAFPLREHWKNRQSESGRYWLAHPPRESRAPLPVLADELLAATGAVVQRGGTSWMDLNILHGRTIHSHRSARLLALLIALGAIEPARHWQEFHSETPAALSLFQHLCQLWIKAPSQTSQPLFDFARNRAEIHLREGRELGWVSPTRLQSHISFLG